MHDLGLKTSIQNFDTFVRCTPMGNQPWPQFQNGIRERSIMKRSELQTKDNKTKQEADRNAYKKHRNLSVKLRRKAVKQYFVNKCRSGIMNNKNLWKTVEPFISNKTNRNEPDIIVTENNNVIKDRKNVANTLNEYFINIAEYTVGRQITALPSQDIEIPYSLGLAPRGAYQN